MSAGRQVLAAYSATETADAISYAAAAVAIAHADYQAAHARRDRMETHKTYFNDERPGPTTWEVTCSGCRADSTVKVNHYPHGPRRVKFCPVCGSTGDAIGVHERSTP